MSDERDSDLGLAAEVQRLRRENAELAARLGEVTAATATATGPRRRKARGRAVAAATLAVLGVLLLFATVPVVWLRAQVLDTDRYLESVAPLGADPALQDEVAAKAAEAINARLDVDALVRDNLPPVAHPLAAPIGLGVREFVEKATSRFTHSTAFERLWVGLNRVGHEQVVAILTGQPTAGGTRVDPDGRLYLDLGPVIDAVKQRLVSAGLAVVGRISPVSLVVEVGRISGVDQARRLVRWLDRLANWLPWLALAAMAGAVALARDRRRMLLLLGTGVFAAMLVLRVAVILLRDAGLAAIPPEAFSPTVAGHLFDEVTAGLRAAGRAVAVLAALIVVTAAVAGPSRAAVRTRAAVVSAAGWIGRRARTGPVGDWVAAHRPGLRIAVAVAAAVAVLFWVRPTPAVLLGIAAAAAALLVVIEVLAAGRRPAPERGAATDSR